MTGIHGILLISTAVLHVVFGLLPLVYGADWKKYIRSGLLNSVQIDNDRSMAAFWFVIFGPVLFLAGLAIYELETQLGVLPASLGWVLLIFSVIGSLVTPKSGFTVLLLPQVIYYLCSI
jgi:hypothetical protein